jgi:hypothetical protein
MSKVLVERARLGGGLKFNRSKDKINTRSFSEDEFDAMPSGRRISLRHDRIERKCDSKSLNENLSPLVRYLRKNVGRKWDDVNAEICENISLENAVQRHILEHVDQYVTIRLEFGFSGLPRFGMFYVDDVGILRENDDYYIRRRKRAENEISKIVISNDEFLEKIDGIWYRHAMGYVECFGYDFASGTIIKRRERRVISKKQLSTKELKLQGLSNDLR